MYTHTEVEVVDMVAPTVVDLLLLIRVYPHGHRSIPLGHWPASQSTRIFPKGVKRLITGDLTALGGIGWVLWCVLYVLFCRLHTCVLDWAPRNKISLGTLGDQN